MKKSSGFVAELGVSDVKAAVEFYRDRLGCSLVEKAEDSAGWSWAELAYEGSSLMLERAELLAAELPGISAQGGDARCAMVLRVAPAEAAVKLLKGLRDAGCSISGGPVWTEYGSFEFSLRDPDGFVIVVAGRD